MRQRLWSQEGQDVAEYAVILAVVILLVVVTVRLLGSSATNIFSTVGKFRHAIGVVASFSASTVTSTSASFLRRTSSPFSSVREFSIRIS